MPSPFPGMDPYLEGPEPWPGCHKHLAAEIAAQLNPLISPKYYADIEVRTAFEEVTLAIPQVMHPDTGILELNPAFPLPHSEPRGGVALLEAPVQRRVNLVAEARLWSVRVFTTGEKQLVTAIEILSPTNKRRGEEIDEYRRKRARILRSSVHLVEIDLLRAGERPGPELQDPPLETEYILLVNRAYPEEYRISDIWPVALNERLPLIPVPLLDPDPDAPLDLNAALGSVYERGAYHWRIDYRQPAPPPALRPVMGAWLKEYLPGVGGLMQNA